MGKIKKIEKVLIIVLLIVLIIVNLFIIFIMKNMSSLTASKPQEVVSQRIEIKQSYQKKELVIDSHTAEYEVYQNNSFVRSFMNYQEAVDFAKNYENTSIKRYGGTTWIWDNTPQYNVYIDESENFKTFSTFSDAVNFAKNCDNSTIFYRKNNKFIWNNHEQIKSYSIIDSIEPIMQYPELHRGCEVTSLAMLINYNGTEIDKMTLAENIRKDSTPYTVKDNKIYYGNPNLGFVGNIYDKSQKGYGVYHRPIFELLTNYIGNDAIDLTGCEFSDLYFYLSKSIPIWVIVNSKFKLLPDSEFQSWSTPTGNISITYSEHSVLITGYDDKYVYINDPMVNKKNIKKEKKDFIAAWEQMGRQAVTYYDK